MFELFSFCSDPLFAQKPGNLKGVGRALGRIAGAGQARPAIERASH